MSKWWQNRHLWVNYSFEGNVKCKARGGAGISSLTVAWGSFPAVTEGCSRLQGLHQAVHHPRLVTFCGEDKAACQSSVSCTTHSHWLQLTYTNPHTVVRLLKTECGSKRKSENRTAIRQGKCGRGQREQRSSLNAQTLRGGGYHMERSQRMKVFTDGHWQVFVLRLAQGS